MNRPGVAPQSIRGMPGFGGQQQQQQQPGRSVSNRLPNGKLAGNGSGWAFGSGVPMGGAGGNLQNPNRQMGGNVSFAQSLSGSQPSTPLDLSEFPSLSNNQQMGNANPSSMWSTAGSRGGAGSTGPVPRNQSTPLSAQPQEDMYNSSSSRGAFRFGGQGQSSQAQPPNPADEFPPLNRNGNGDIGGERTANLMSSLGFGGAQGGAAPASQGQAPGNRAAGNGLLNALSANSRSTDSASPAAGSRPPGLGGPGDERKASLGLSGSGAAEASSGGQEAQHPHGAIGNEPSVGKANDGEDDPAAEVQDPLAGMAPIDKFGIKGLQTMMSTFPTYSALMQGMDPTELGLNVNSSDLISTQTYSLFDDTPPRPAIPSFKLPECYRVTNVQPIKSKIQAFNEETLFWIFYSCPQDEKQNLAAAELHSRNWRWHKKLHLWLTKDDMMTPQSISPTHEQGYYIIWDTRNWRKERRELTLLYDELETSLGTRPPMP